MAHHPQMGNTNHKDVEIICESHHHVFFTIIFIRDDFYVNNGFAFDLQLGNLYLFGEANKFHDSILFSQQNVEGGLWIWKC